ncbi:serine hydrolase domain-containing protein [Cryptosporangium sp. NPDC051539]|uniref:serine hydrolase domain-containing protein n=1 Tax=Cryptosporangium sp. NPDC051539 TaxID=3363962 RepID=UPI0037B0A055
MSRRYQALALVAALTVSLTGCGASAAARTPTPGTRLAALAQQTVDAGAPGVVVRVDQGDGQVIEIARQAPWSRADHVLAAGDEFRMGSNTKTMVATVVLQLVAERRLRLTDPVGNWLPEIPNSSAITVRMLLNHTSGLFNYAFDPDVLKSFTGQDTRPWSPDELIAAAVRHDPLFAPGTAYSYSNTNYVALGLIAEKASGSTISDLIRERITRPLHLTHTYLVAGSDRGPLLTHGYEPEASRLAPVLPAGAPAGTAFAGPARPGGYVDTTGIRPGTEWAAGGMVSTARDWARFDTALMSGRLLPAAQLAEMKTTVAEESGNPNRYGLGVEKKVTPCGPVWGHDGQVPGYSSWEYTDETGRRTVSVLITTIFGVASPRPAAATQALLNTAICTMRAAPLKH